MHPAAADMSYISASVLYQDRYLYLAFNDERLYRIYDIADPASPVQIFESGEILNICDLVISGDRMYISGFEANGSPAAFQEWDISDQFHPTLSAAGTNPLNISRLSVTDEYVFGLDRMYGLHIYQKN